MSKPVDEAAAPAARTIRALAILVGLGLANALWALFLWAELLLARVGQKPFCALGEGADCASLWDGGFASAIHSATGVPIAGWGLAYGLVATLLPLVALERLASRKDASALVTASRLIAFAGAGGVVVLAAAAAAASVFCLGCTVTYVITAVAAGVALALLPKGMPELPKAAGTTVLALAAAFLVVLYPGAQTPKSAAKAEQEAMKGALVDAPPKKPADPSPAEPAKVDPADMTKPGTPEAIARGRAFLSSLPPEMKQAVADSVGMWRASKSVPARPPRAIIGDPNASVLITDFTDARCGHCAQFHATLKDILGAVPPDAFKLEARHFPLDKSCNAEVQRQAPDPASCVAAKIEVCMEGHPRAFELAAVMFENGRDLTSEKVWQLASSFAPRAELEKCVSDPATQAKINDDVAWAMEHELEGTPLILVNGRKATSFGPFVFAAILSGGDPQSPIWEGLPPPRADAHIH